MMHVATITDNDKIDKCQFMPLRFVLTAFGLLYKILSTSAQHKEENYS